MIRILLICTAIIINHSIIAQDTLWLASSILNEDRAQLRYLPPNYDESKKYPVVYVFDASSMFEPTVNVISNYSNPTFDVIPPCIVIGILHKNRNQDMDIDWWDTGELNPGGELFKKYVTDELMTEVDKSYSTSGFNITVGHSNGSAFINYFVSDPESPFNGYIGLSQLLTKSVQLEFENLVQGASAKDIYFFAGTGTRDADDRVKSGLIFDSLFFQNKNQGFKAKHQNYPTDHAGIGVMGIDDGLAHVFQDYYHYNDWMDDAVQYLKTNKIDPIQYFEEHSKRIFDNYGVKFIPNDNDIFFLSYVASQSQELEAMQRVMEYEKEKLGIRDGFYFLNAQMFEQGKAYEKAEEFYNLHLDSDHKKGFLSYYRLFRLYSKKTQEPVKAFATAENAFISCDAEQESFLYLQGMISADHNHRNEDGLSAMVKYIENYQDGHRYDLHHAYRRKAMIHHNLEQKEEALLAVKKGLELMPNDEKLLLLQKEYSK